MLLDIQKIFSTYRKPVCIQAGVDLSTEDFPGYAVPEPVDARVRAVLEGNVLDLSLDMEPVLQFQCARCMEEVRKVFPVHTSYAIRKGDWADPDTELPFAPDGKLDLRELCYSELVVEVPTVLLCSDDCAGLCPVCGCRKPCACTQETSGVAVDERLAILKQLLTE